MKNSSGLKKQLLLKAALTLIFISVVVCFTLPSSACSFSEKERVENLALTSEEVLTWSPVSGADGYEITVNDKTLYSTENKIDLFFELDDDIDYVVSVRAYSDSDKGERVFGERSEPLTYAVPVLPAGSYAYAPSSDGSGYQIKLADPSKVQGKFVIPLEINETMVTQIATAGFAEATGLTGIIFSDYVTEIGTRAFENCSSLKMCRLPDYLDELDNNVFAACSSLEKVVFNDRLKLIRQWCFSDCTSLKEITLPNGIEEIRDRCFLRCYALEKVFIPKTLTNLRDHPFWGCGLKEITADENNERYYVEGNCLIERENKTLVLGTDNSIIPEDVPVIGGAAFAGKTFETIVIPETVVEIGISAFIACKNLKEITLPKGLKVLGGSCFSDCYALEEITVPSKVKELQAGCFDNCRSLKRITIEEGVERIGAPETNPDLYETAVGIYGVTVFEVCERLTEIYIPSSVKKIGCRAFNDMVNLEKIEVAEDNPYYRTENGCLIERATDTLVSGVKNAIIPDSVTAVGHYAFRGITMDHVDIPSNVISIGDYAFLECDTLEYVLLPDTLKYIGTEAFALCFSSIVLPSIDGEIVYGCFYMNTVYTSLSLEQIHNAYAITLVNSQLEKHGDNYYVKTIYISCERMPSEKELYLSNPSFLFENWFVAPYRPGYEFLGWSYTESENDIVFHVARSAFIATACLYPYKQYSVDERNLCVDMYKMKDILGEVTLHAIWKKL